MRQTYFTDRISYIYLTDGLHLLHRLRLRLFNYYFVINLMKLGGAGYLSAIALAEVGP